MSQGCECSCQEPTWYSITVKLNDTAQLFSRNSVQSDRTKRQHRRRQQQQRQKQTTEKVRGLKKKTPRTRMYHIQTPHDTLPTRSKHCCSLATATPAGIGQLLWTTFVGLRTSRPLLSSMADTSGLKVRPGTSLRQMHVFIRRMHRVGEEDITPPTDNLLRPDDRFLLNDVFIDLSGQT